ncbi:MAG: glycosyltransferase family 87 protein [Chthoniobacterales bacterium]
MDHPPPPSPAAARGSKALLWLLIFAYVPFLFAHGIACLTEPAVDFPPLYSATKAVFDQHASPYGENAFAEQALALGRPVPPFIYPPPSLLVFFPLHWFSYDTAKALMLVVNHLCFLVAIALLFRRLFRDEFARAPTQLTAALVLIYLLLFDPAVVTLHLGQVNLLLLVCITLMWIALRRSGSAVAVAIPLTFAIVVKTYPALLVGLLVLRKRPKAAAYTLGFFALACAASYFLLPHGIWSDWLTKVMPAGDNAHPGPWNQNIRAFVARTFVPNGFSEPLFAAPSLAKPLIYLLSLGVALPTLWASVRCWRRPHSPRQIDFQMSLYLLMIFLIAPVSWEHHFVYLLPTLVLLILMLLNGEVHGQWKWIVALALCLIAWRLPITAPWLTKGVATLGISAKFYPAVALWLFFLTRTWQLGGEQPALESQIA